MTTHKEDMMVHLTYRALLFGGQFWQKLVQTPCPNDQHSYHIHKLNDKVTRARKKYAGIFEANMTSLGEKCGIKDPAGNVLKDPASHLPQVDPTKRDEYEDLLEEYMHQTVEIGYKKLPYDYFGHIQKTPMDWQVLEHISDVSAEGLEKAENSKKHAHEALRSIGGQG
jgi:hypothetical protein